MFSAESHWQNVWDAKSHTETSWFQEAPGPSLAFVDALNLSPEDPIIDVGCGQSFLVDELLQRGFRSLHLLDISQSAVDAVTNRILPLADNVQLVTHAKDILEQEPIEGIALWHDRAVLHFLREPRERSHYAELAAASVRPGGYMVIASFSPDGPEQCSNLDVERVDESAVAKLFAQGFHMFESTRMKHVTPWGSEQDFQWCLLQRR